MKFKRKLIIISFILIVIACGVGYGFYQAVVDENSLSISEKKWIDNNISNVYSIAIPNDIAVFGNTGEGVFFDFINYLTDTTKLEINKNTVSYLSSNEGYRFEITNGYLKDGLLMYKDNYVLVSRNTGIITNTSMIPSMGVGVVNNNMSQVKAYFGAGDESFRAYESYSKITEDLGNGNLSYALVPLNEYKSELISNNINVLAFISDLNRYYYLRLSDNEVLNSILTKKFAIFMKKKFHDSYNKSDYQLFIDCLGITEAEEDMLTNRVYKYGFAEMKPYEVLAGSDYGGITSEYLREFSEFSGVEFTHKKYKTSSDLASAAVAGKIDLYYNYYNILTNYIDCGALKNISYFVIAHNESDLSMSNIQGLANEEVYVLKNSYLYDMIKDIPDIKVITYERDEELNKIIKKPCIIVIDELKFRFYVNNLTNEYSVRYSDEVGAETYSFKYANDTDVFYRLFNAYTKTLNPTDVKRRGVTTFNQVENKGKVIGSIAKFLLLFIMFGGTIIFLLHKKTTNIKLDTKVKKEDRLKYIDLLTSLKNRNYYNEKLNTWNKNTIYPQTCIVMDINNVKELNDTLGHEEGDKQIQAVANILIKTQIDNSELIRTDGNEFLVYMVGYSEKQVLTYIKKLVKEFKNLPYDTGVAMGFSMIEDDTKLIDDAFNEASIKMRENKDLEEDLEDDKED